MKLLGTTPQLGNAFPQGVVKITYQSALDGRQDWALILPGSNPELWVINLHGHGAHGDQLYTRQDIREAWLPPFIDTGAGIMTPNLRDNAWMGPAAVHDLHELLDYLRQQYGMKKTLFFSGSMGGTGNLIYSVLYPEDVNVVVALGAATDLKTYYDWCLNQESSSVVQEIAAAIRANYSDCDYDVHSVVRHADRLTMPVYYIHGEKDAVIPVEQARMLAEKLMGKLNFFCKEIPGGGHDAPLYEVQYLAEALKRLSHEGTEQSGGKA